MVGTYVPLPALDLVASCGGALAVAAIAYRLAYSRTGAIGARGAVALHDSAVYAAAIGAAGAFWFGGDALIVLFAIVSAFALADFVTQGSGNSRGLYAACYYGCVPLQFGALAARRLDLALVMLPLVAMIALPLLMLAQGGTRQFFERASQRLWGVMAWVYCLSFVPALILIDGPAFEDRNGGLVAFVVAVTLATQPIASWRSATSPVRIWIVRVLVLSALGAALAGMTPFPVPVAAALALVTAIAGSVGAFVLGKMRSQRVAYSQATGALGRIAQHLDALVFAAPVSFLAVRAALAW